MWWVSICTIRFISSIPPLFRWPVTNKIFMHIHVMYKWQCIYATVQYVIFLVLVEPGIDYFMWSCPCLPFCSHIEIKRMKEKPSVLSTLLSVACQNETYHMLVHAIQPPPPHFCEQLLSGCQPAAAPPPHDHGETFSHSGWGPLKAAHKSCWMWMHTVGSSWLFKWKIGLHILQPTKLNVCQPYIMACQVHSSFLQFQAGNKNMSFIKPYIVGRLHLAGLCVPGVRENVLFETALRCFIMWFNTVQIYICAVLPFQNLIDVSPACFAGKVDN